MGRRQTFKFLITCIDQPQCRVNFEPEGAEFTLLQGDRLTAEITGTGSAEVEVSAYPGGVIIGAWSGADTTVWNAAGEQIEPRK